MKASRLFVSLTLLNLPLAALAQNSGSHGGDECEREFIRIGKNLRDWIHEGGPRLLKYRGNDNAENYSSRMLALLDPLLSEDPVVKAGATQVECVSEPIKVEGIEKTCAWKPIDEKNPAGRKIIQCHHPRFLGRKPYPKDDPGQLRESHHEWAGIADLEPSVPGGRSDYWYSDQVTSQGEWVPVFMIPIRASRPAVETLTGQISLDSVHSGDQACKLQLQSRILAIFARAFGLPYKKRKKCQSLGENLIECNERSIPVRYDPFRPVMKHAWDILENASVIPNRFQLSGVSGMDTLHLKLIQGSRFETRVAYDRSLLSGTRDTRTYDYLPILLPTLNYSLDATKPNTTYDALGAPVSHSPHSFIKTLQWRDTGSETDPVAVNAETGVASEIAIPIGEYRKCLFDVYRRNAP